MSQFGSEDNNTCQRNGKYHKGHMQCVREEKRKEAQARQRRKKLATNDPGRHVWVPSPLDFSCICNNDGCKAIWTEAEAHAPKTVCPQLTRFVGEQSTELVRTKPDDRIASLSESS